MSSSPGCFRDISSLAYCLNLDFLASEIHYRLRVLAVMDPKTFSQGVLDTRHLTIRTGDIQETKEEMRLGICDWRTFEDRKGWTATKSFRQCYCPTICYYHGVREQVCPQRKGTSVKNGVSMHPAERNSEAATQEISGQ